MNPITRKDFEKFIQDCEKAALKPRRPMLIMVHPRDYEWVKRFFEGRDD